MYRYMWTGSFSQASDVSAGSSQHQRVVALLWGQRIPKSLKRSPGVRLSVLPNHHRALRRSVHLFRQPSALESRDPERYPESLPRRRGRRVSELAVASSSHEGDHADSHEAGGREGGHASSRKSSLKYGTVAKAGGGT